MSRRSRSLLVVPVSLALLLAGCGGDEGEREGSSAEAKPYVDAMAASMIGKDSPFNRKQARCFSERLVDVVGLDRVEAAGTPQEVAGEGSAIELDHLDIDRAQGEQIYAGFDDCGVDMRQTFVDRMAQDDTVDPETRSCLEEAVSDERLEEYFVTTMVDGEEAADGGKGSDELVGAMMGCMLDGMEQGSPEG